MNEEINKKAEELKEAAELPDDELDGAAGGGASGLNAMKVVGKERQTAVALAQMECPACKGRGARVDNLRMICNSCGHVIR